MTIEMLQKWLVAPAETERLDFKEARQKFEPDKLLRYCVALANERGGHLIMGERTNLRARSSVPTPSPRRTNSTT